MNVKARRLHFPPFFRQSYQPMNLLKRTLAAALLSISLVACGGTALDGALPCDSSTPPAACGTACDDTTRCETGFYCASSACTADCRYLGREQGCPRGETCSDTGQCQAN